TAVMGHQDSARYLGAVALGGLLFSFIYWGFGFLRMGTTGLAAQAFGRNEYDEIRAVLARSALLAFSIAAMLLILRGPLAWLGFAIIDGEADTENLAKHYFAIRIWSAPATLSLYVLSGWFLGMQNVRSPLLIVVITNLVNIALDLLLVVHWNMGVAGVAWATVLAEYAGLILGVVLLMRVLRHQAGVWSWLAVKNTGALLKMMVINTDLFVRTLCLIFAFAFFTVQGARFGEVLLAANAVLLNFQTFMAYALDGFAHAAEALAGKAKGADDRFLFKQALMTAGTWSLVVALGFSGCYALFGTHIIDLLTGLEPVRAAAYAYLPWLVALPLVSVTCYLLDGIFIGATLSRDMRNTMLFSLIAVFLPAWYLAQPLENHGLWLALLLFMAARGFSMAWLFFIHRRDYVRTV
ncbi:MAG: MATE family efflux transporter, partial [Gammaproteobacteria bacterium]